MLTSSSDYHIFNKLKFNSRQECMDSYCEVVDGVAHWVNEFKVALSLWSAPNVCEVDPTRTLPAIFPDGGKA